MVSPSERILGTYFEKKSWRSSSFVFVLILYLIVISCLDVPVARASAGPKNINNASHQRLTASCTISLCFSVPSAKAMMIASPCWAWNTSSAQIRFNALA
ncbi:Uncharacterised protein [Mycobacteroides abscessus subsp. abscessus]|nr:Uncharacterised protein [Mycobacteroides abscessus subsp. abscessus]